MFVRFLYTVWCGAIVLSIPKVVRRPECRVKQIVFPHLFLFIAYSREQVGIIHYIMKKNILIVAMVLGCLSCGSKAEKSVDKQKDLVKEYIEKIENVQSKEEFDQLRRECNDRLRFENDKLTREEKEEYERNMSWEENQELKELGKKKREVEKEVRSRFE